jgi:hypothetical protein
MRARAIFISVFIILLIFVLLHVIKVPVQDVKMTTELMPYVVLDYYTAQEEIADRNCISRNFSYSYEWQGWSEDDSEFITPYIEIFNYEGESGKFAVQFAFFDADEFPYQAVKDTITWDQATMYSREEYVTVKPHGSNLISIPTKKIRQGEDYWAIGDIKPPVVVECAEPKLRTVIKNRTIAKNKTVERTEFVESKISLWKFLLS